MAIRKTNMNIWYKAYYDFITVSTYISSVTRYNGGIKRICRSLKKAIFPKSNTNSMNIMIPLKYFKERLWSDQAIIFALNKSKEALWSELWNL